MCNISQFITTFNFITCEIKGFRKLVVSFVCSSVSLQVTSYKQSSPFVFCKYIVTTWRTDLKKWAKICRGYGSLWNWESTVRVCTQKPHTTYCTASDSMQSVYTTEYSMITHNALRFYPSWNRQAEALNSKHFSSKLFKYHFVKIFFLKQAKKWPFLVNVDHWVNIHKSTFCQILITLEKCLMMLRKQIQIFVLFRYILQSSHLVVWNFDTLTLWTYKHICLIFSHLSENSENSCRIQGGQQYKHCKLCSEQLGPN